MPPRRVWRSGALTAPVVRERLGQEERTEIGGFLLRQRYLRLANALYGPLSAAARRREIAPCSARVNLALVRIAWRVWIDFDAAADKDGSDRECL